MLPWSSQRSSEKKGLQISNRLEFDFEQWGAMEPGGWKRTDHPFMHFRPGAPESTRRTVWQQVPRRGLLKAETVLRLCPGLLGYEEA